MSVHTSVSGSAREVLVFTIHNVHLCSGVPVLLGQPKVNDKQLKGYLICVGGGEREGEIIRHEY